MPNNDYRSAVHSMLSSAYEGEFKLSEADFRNKLDSNPEYAKTVYSLMSSAFPSEFKLKENEFTSKMYSDPKATSTPTADPQQAAAPQEQAPTYVGPGLKYKPYFKHMLPSLRESQTFQRLLSEYDPRDPNQGVITANMQSLKKRSGELIGINKANWKTDEYTTLDAMIKEAQARYASQSEPMYNENKEALDEYAKLSAQANDIVKQLNSAAKQRDSFSNTNISTDDRKALGAIKAQYDNILATFKDKDKVFSRLQTEIEGQAQELKMAYENGIPDVMLPDYNQSVDDFNQRLSNEYSPAKKERDTLVERMKELDIAHQSIVSKYPGFSDPKYVSLNGTIKALYSQYNQLLNKIEDYESNYGPVIKTISDNYSYIEELEKFRKELYYKGTYDQQELKNKDTEYLEILDVADVHTPLAKFVISTLGRTANVALNNIKNVLSLPTEMTSDWPGDQLNPQATFLKSAVELLDFVSQDEKPSFAPTDLESPFSGQTMLKYNKFEKWDDKTGEWHKTSAAIAQEGIAQIAQIYVAGGMTRALMVGAEAVSAGRAISSISKVGFRGSKAELLGFAKTAGVSTGVMTAISLPNYYKEGLMKFGDNDFAKTYAISMSAAEGLLETILPDANLVGKFSKSLNVADLYKIYKLEGKKGISKILKDRIVDVGKENIEEIGAQGMGALLERLGAHFGAEGTDGVNSVTDWDWNETAETAAIVSVSMGVLGLPGAYGAIKMGAKGAMPSPARSRAIFEMAKRYNPEVEGNEVILGLNSLLSTGAASQKEIADLELHIKAANLVMQNIGIDSLNVGQRTKEAIAVTLADAQVEADRLSQLASGANSEKLLRTVEGINAAAQNKVAEILADPDFEQKSADQELAEAQENEKLLNEELEKNKKEQTALGANMPMATHAVGATVEYGGRIGTIELSETNRVLFVDEETGKSEELPLEDHTLDSAMNAGVRIIEGVANSNVMDQLDIVLMDVPGSTVSGGRRKPYYVQVKSKENKIADENALVFSQSKKSKALHEVKDPALKSRIIAAYNKQAEQSSLPGVVSQNKDSVDQRAAEDPATRDVSYVQKAIGSKESLPEEADAAREELEKKRKSGVIAQDLRDGVISYSDVSKAYSAVGMPVVPLDIRTEFAEKEDEYDTPEASADPEQQSGAETAPMGKQRRIQVRGRSFVLPDTVSILSSEKEMEKKRSYATKGSLLHSNLGMLLKVQRALNKLFGKGSVKYAIFWNEDDFTQFTSQVNPGNTGNAFYDRSSNTIFLSSQTLLTEDKFHESIHPIVSAYFSTPDGEVKMKNFYQQILDESRDDYSKWRDQTGNTRTLNDYISSAVKLWTSIRSVDMKKLAKVDPEAYYFLSMSTSTYSHAWMEFYMELGKVSGKPISFDTMINEGVTEYATTLVAMAANSNPNDKPTKRLFSLVDMVMSKVGFSKKSNTMPTSPAGINDIIKAQSLKSFAKGIADAFTTQEAREGRSLELRLPGGSNDIMNSKRGDENPYLKDVESTAKALEKIDVKNDVLKLKDAGYGKVSSDIVNPSTIPLVSDRIRANYLLNPQEYIDSEDYSKAARNKLNSDNDFVYVKETPTHLIMTEEWTIGSKQGLRDKYGDDSNKTIEDKFVPRIKMVGELLALKFVSHRIDGNDSIIIFKKQTPESISEAYHKAKADGSNPELVKAVEELLAPQGNKNKSGLSNDVLLSMRGAWDIEFDQRVADMRLKAAEDIEKNPISVSFAARRVLPAQLYKQNEWLYKLADRIGVKAILDSQKLLNAGATGAYLPGSRRIVVGRPTVTNGWADAISTLNHEVIHALLDPANNLITESQRSKLRDSITRMYLRVANTLHVDMLESKDDEDAMWSMSRIKRILDLYSPAENKARWNEIDWEEFVTYAFTNPVFNSYLMSVRAVSSDSKKTSAEQHVFGRMRDEMTDVFGGATKVPTIVDELATKLDSAIGETVSSSDVIKKKNGKIVFSKRANMSALSDEEILEAISKVPQSVKDNLLNSAKDFYYVHRHLPVEYDPNWTDTQYFATDVDYSRTFGKHKVSFLIQEKDVLNFEDYNNMFRSRPGSERYLIAGSPDKSMNLFEIHSDNYAKGEITIPLLSYGRVMGQDAMEELKDKMDKYKVHMSNDLGSSSIAFAVKETSVLVDPNKWLLNFVKTGDLNTVFNTDAAEVFMVHAADSHFGNVDFSMRAWHGSRYRFGRFSTENIGTGEGNQAFGWGLYFTDLEDIARNYADKLSELKVGDISFEKILEDSAGHPSGKRAIISAYNFINSWSMRDNFKIIDYKTLKEYIESDSFYEKANGVYDRRSIQKEIGSVDGLYNFVSDILDVAKKNKKNLKSTRLLYEVAIHKGKTPDQYTWLEWDKPVTNTPISKIDKTILGQKIIDSNTSLQGLSPNEQYIQLEVDAVIGALNGERAYRSLSRLLGGDKQASLFLLDAGIDGVKYPAESISRGATSDTARGFNYVVFDENAVEIENMVSFSMRSRELGKATRIFDVFAGQQTALNVVNRNAYRLYTPQRWAELQPRLDSLSEADLIDYIDNGDASSIQSFIDDLGRNNASNGNMWVLANIELMNRYEQAGDQVAAANVYEKLMVSATYFGQALAQYAKLKSSSSEFLTRRIVELIASYGRSITSTQRARLSSDIARMMAAQRALSEYLVAQKSELDQYGSSNFDISVYNSLDSARIAANKRLDENLSKLVPQSLWEALGVNMRGNLLTLGSATIGLFTNVTNLLFGAFGARGVASRVFDLALSPLVPGQKTRTMNPMSAMEIFYYTTRRFFSRQNMSRYYGILTDGNTFDGMARDKYDVSRSLRPILSMRSGMRMLQEIAENDFSEFETSFKKLSKSYDSVSWSADLRANTISLSFRMGGRVVGEFTTDAGSYTDFIDNAVVINDIESSIRSGVNSGTVNESGTAFIPKGSKTEAGIKIFAGGVFATIAASMLRAIQISDTPIREAVSFGRMYEYGYVMGLRGADLELFSRAPHLWGQQMATHVETEATAVTFQEHSLLGDKIKELVGGDTKLPDDLKGNLLMRGSRRFIFSSVQPFISFPANFLSQSLEYIVWQYTAFKAMYYFSKMKSAATVGERDVLRQKAIRSASTAIVGYALKTMATALVNAGLVTIPPDDDDRKQKATGIGVGDRKFNASGLSRWLNDGGLANTESRAGEYQKGDQLWSIESLGVLGMAVQVEVAGVANTVQYNTDAVVLGTKDAGKKMKDAKEKGLNRRSDSTGTMDEVSALAYNSMDDAITLISSAFEFGFMQGTQNFLTSLPKMEQGSRSFEVNKLISGMTKAAAAAVLPGSGLANQLNRYAIEQKRSEAEQNGDDTFGLDVFTQKKPGAKGSIAETVTSSLKTSLSAYGMGTITPELMVNKDVFPATDMFGQPVTYSGKPKNIAFYMLNPTRSEEADFDEQELFLYSLQKSVTNTATDPTGRVIPDLPISEMYINVKTQGGMSVNVAVGAKEWANFNKLAGAYVREQVYQLLDEYSYKDIDPFKLTTERSELIAKLDELYTTLGTGKKLAINSGDENILNAWEELKNSAIGRLDMNPELEEIEEPSGDGNNTDLKSSVINAIEQD